MDQHPIPRQITTFEFKLIGFMTLRQFLYLIVAFPVAYIVMTIFPIPVINVLLAILIVVAGIVTAFIPIQDRSLDIWAKNLWKRLQNPTQYYYQKRNDSLYFLKDLYFLADPHHMLAHIESKEKLSQYLAMTKQKTRPNYRKKQVSTLLQSPTVQLRQPAPNVANDAAPVPAAPRAPTVDELTRDMANPAPLPYAPLSAPAPAPMPQPQRDTVSGSPAPAAVSHGPQTPIVRPGPQTPIVRPGQEASPAVPAPMPAVAPVTAPVPAPVPVTQVVPDVKPVPMPQVIPPAPGPPVQETLPSTFKPPAPAVPAAQVAPAAPQTVPMPQVIPPAPEPAQPAPTPVAAAPVPAAPEPVPPPAAPVAPVPQPVSQTVAVPAAAATPAKAPVPPPTLVSASQPFFVGVVRNSKKIPLPGIMVYVKDESGSPVRLMKTNPHGVFATYNALPSKSYTFEIKDPNGTYFFDTMNVPVRDVNPLSIEFQSKEIL
jgi:hypothetical protein